MQEILEAVDNGLVKSIQGCVVVLLIDLNIVQTIVLEITTVIKYLLLKIF